MEAVVAARDVLPLVVPCFVGIFTGLNNAEHLGNPPRAIVRGSFTAVAASWALYSALLTLIAAAVPRDILATNTMAVAQMAFPSPLLAIVGIVLVGVGSALQCLKNASQLLQRAAVDNIIPALRTVRVHRTSDMGVPRYAIVATAVAASVFLLIPELESLAVVVTIAFLLAYACTNFVCMLLAGLESPSWRPMFKVSDVATMFKMKNIHSL
jgi:hypothetical protein